MQTDQFNNRKDVEEFIKYAFDLHDAMPVYHSVASRNTSSDTILDSQQQYIKRQIESNIDKWKDVPIKDAENILNNVWAGAFTKGVIYYSCLTRALDDPFSPEITVTYEDVQERIFKRLDPSTDDASRFYALIENLGPIATLRNVSADEIIETIKHIEIVNDNIDFFFSLACNNFIYGMAAEDSYIQAAKETIIRNQFMSGIIEQKFDIYIDPYSPDFNQQADEIIITSMKHRQHLN